MLIDGEYFLFTPFVIHSIYFKWGWNFAYLCGDRRTPQFTSETNDIWLSEPIYPPCRIRKKNLLVALFAGADATKDTSWMRTDFVFIDQYSSNDWQEKSLSRTLILITKYFYFWIVPISYHEVRIAVEMSSSDVFWSPVSLASGISLTDLWTHKVTVIY